MKTTKLVGLANLLIKSRRIRIALVAVELGVLLYAYKKSGQAREDAKKLKSNAPKSIES